MEVNVKEFRIGNYIEWCGAIDFIKVINTKNENFEYIETCSYLDIPISEIKPIQLTEDILLKCGFEKGSNIIGDCYFIEHDFGISDFVLNITKTSNFNIYELDLTINYLHQLQNLYFALTNEELIINL